MQGFYNITEQIRLQLAQDEFVNTVTYGDIFRVDLKKQTIFPLSHVVVNNTTVEGNVLRYSMSVMAMDIVDISKDAIDNTAIGQYRGNDNEQDVMNTQQAVLLRLLKVLEGGELFTNLYQLNGNPNLEPFTERFENYLAGWVATFDVLIPNDMTACDGATIPSNICEDVDVYVGEENTGSFPSGSDVFVTVTQDGFEVIPENIIVTGNDIDIILANTLDTTIEVNGTTEGTFASGSTVDVQLSDSGGVVTPTSVTVVGNDVQIVLADVVGASVGATLMQTGQTVSYRTGDNPTTGRDVNFLTLASNNPFGNTNRFTDELGGSTYTNNIVIDWSTYNGSTVLGYSKNYQGANVVWNTAIDNSLSFALGTFTSGWRLVNRKELENIINENAPSNRVLNYAPFNNTFDTNYWTSTTCKYDTTRAWILGSNSTGWIYGLPKTSGACSYYACRTFTVTGTTLT
jgi:hypothetical protein